MDYRLATAMRGPDHEEAEGVTFWKDLVTAPLRWMAVKEMNCVPLVWALGTIHAPERVLETLNTDEFMVREAQKFAGNDKSCHVKEHARAAFEYLMTTSQRPIAMELRHALYSKGLL